MQRKILTVAVMCGTALSSMISAPVLATPGVASALSSETQGTMADVCAADLAAAVNIGDTTHNGETVWATEVVETGSSAGAASEVSRAETPGSRFGTGSATYSNLSISGNPYRNGGSVNMFGDQVATVKNWAGSEYDFTATYDTVTTFSYECHVTQVTEHYNEPTGEHGHPADGYYEPRYDDQGMTGGQGGGNHEKDNGNGGEGAHTNACNMYNLKNPNVTGVAWTPWGGDQGNCMFTETSPAVEDTYVPGYWETDGTVDRTDLNTSHTIDQTDTDYDVPGHEVNGGPWSQNGSWFVQQAVICISPGKKGGTWTRQNGYLGDKCTTAYFNEGHYGHGSQTSNGTYISVPAN